MSACVCRGSACEKLLILNPFSRVASWLLTAACAMAPGGLAGSTHLCLACCGGGSYVGGDDALFAGLHGRSGVGCSATGHRVACSRRAWRRLGLLHFILGSAHVPTTHEWVGHPPPCRWLHQLA